MVGARTLGRQPGHDLVSYAHRVLHSHSSGALLTEFCGYFGSHFACQLFRHDELGANDLHLFHQISSVRRCREPKRMCYWEIGHRDLEKAMRWQVPTQV